jgi:hypothetical protein
LKAGSENFQPLDFRSRNSSHLRASSRYSLQIGTSIPHVVGAEQQYLFNEKSGPADSLQLEEPAESAHSMGLLHMKTKLLFCALLFSTSVYAQEQHFRPKVFWSEVAALTVADTLDGYSTVTRDACGSPWHAVELASPFLYGNHPTPVRYSLVSGGIDATAALLAWKFEHSHRRWVAGIGHSLLGAACQAHVAGAKHNFELPKGITISGGQAAAR